MKIIVMIMFMLSFLNAEELKIKSDTVQADQNTNVSIFEGNVHVQKGKDKLQSSKLTIHLDKKNKPLKFIAEGKAFFELVAQNGSKYSGKAEKVVYLPNIKEYHFFTNVHLKQLDEKKEILGEEVILQLKVGKAFAKGASKGPVIMIFELPEEK